jgi:hypothetical protein
MRQMQQTFRDVEGSIYATLRNKQNMLYVLRQP